jgi:hypothetical protein
LSQPRCRALLQRISTRYHIKPLDLNGAYEYISNRLKIAGAKPGNKIFSMDAIKAIHHYSGGYPREINVLADNALLLGYARGERKITASMIKECHDDLQIQDVERKTVTIGDKNPKIEVTSNNRPIRQWKRTALIILLSVLAGVVIDRYGEPLFRLITTYVSLDHQNPAESTTKARSRIKQRIDQTLTETPDDHVAEKKAEISEMKSGETKGTSPIRPEGPDNKPQ